jgi:hypothetical protein
MLITAALEYVPAKQPRATTSLSTTTELCGGEDEFVLESDDQSDDDIPMNSEALADFSGQE